MALVLSVALGRCFVIHATATILPDCFSSSHAVTACAWAPQGSRLQSTDVFTIVGRSTTRLRLFSGRVYIEVTQFKTQVPVNLVHNRNFQPASFISCMRASAFEVPAPVLLVPHPMESSASLLYVVRSFCCGRDSPVYVVVRFTAFYHSWR